MSTHIKLMSEHEWEGPTTQEIRPTYLHSIYHDY